MQSAGFVFPFLVRCFVSLNKTGGTNPSTKSSSTGLTDSSARTLGRNDGEMEEIPLLATS
ncbi:hypothetical protein, partial [Arcticibacter sp.]|uniref:hypothetical protein n=1 Tax=Arcticibacter sp. TaxID=1872630 RepID=UPI003890ED33